MDHYPETIVNKIALETNQSTNKRYSFPDEVCVPIKILQDLCKKRPLDHSKSIRKKTRTEGEKEKGSIKGKLISAWDCCSEEPICVDELDI